MSNLKIRALAMATLLSMVLCIVWMDLEIYFYGQATSRVVDNIIFIPIYISLYFNSKQIIRWLSSR